MKFVWQVKEDIRNSIADLDPYVLGLPDTDLLVRGTDPDPTPSIIKQN